MCLLWYVYKVNRMRYTVNYSFLLSKQNVFNASNSAISEANSAMAISTNCFALIQSTFELYIGRLKVGWHCPVP